MNDKRINHAPAMSLLSPGPDYVSLYEVGLMDAMDDARHDLLVGAHRLGFIDWRSLHWLRIPGVAAPTTADVLDAIKAAEAALALERQAGPETDADLRRRIEQRLKTQPGAFDMEPGYGVDLECIALMHGISRRVE